MAAPWKKLPPGWRVWEDGDPWEEEEDDEESGGGEEEDEGGGDEGGGGGEGEGEGGSGEGGGGGGEGGEGGGEFGGGEFGGGGDGGGGDSGDNGISYGGDYDNDGDGLDDNAVSVSWADSRRQEERDFDADRGRDEFERDFERQQRQVEEEAEKQRQADEFQQQYQENQRLAEAFRAQEVSQTLPQIGQPVPDQTSQLLTGLQQANQGSTTSPPGWSGLFSPPTEDAAQPPVEPERPLEQGAPPPAGGGGSLTAEQAADWVARGINPLTGEPIERTSAPGDTTTGPTGQPPARDDWARPQAPPTAYSTGPTGQPPQRDDWTTRPGGPGTTGPTGIPARDDWARPPAAGATTAAATAAAAGAAAAGATPDQVAATAEQAARIVWDNQTLAQQTPWTRASFRSEFGANAEAEWQRQHLAELGRNKALYGVQEPMAGATPRVGAPAGTPLAPNRQIGATPPPGFGETGQYGINRPRGASAPAVSAAAVAASPGAAVSPAPSSGQASAPAAAVPPTTGALPTGWTPLPNQGEPRPATVLPKPTPPPAPSEPAAPAAPFTPWRPTPPVAAPGATPAEAPAPGEAPESITPTDLAPAEPQTGLTTGSDDIYAALNLDPVSGEAIYNDASTLPTTTIIKDPTQVQSVADLSIAARQSTMNRAYGPPVQVYIEPNGQMYSVGPDGALRWEGKTQGDYERAQPIVTVAATDPTDPSGKPTRFSVQDWNKLSPEQQQQYQNVSAQTFTQPPNVVKIGTPPPRTDPALTAPGIIPRPGPGEPSATPPSANDIMNGIIRGLPPQAPSGLSRQAMGAGRTSDSPFMIAGMSTDGELTPEQEAEARGVGWGVSGDRPIGVQPGANPIQYDENGNEILPALQRGQPQKIRYDVYGREIPEENLPSWYPPIVPGPGGGNRALSEQVTLQGERGAALPTASLPSSNVPSINPVTGEPTGLSHENPDIARAAADPFGTIVDNAGRLQGATDLTGFRASVAGGAVKGEEWAEPYMNDVARMAWYQETGGREGAPQDAPTQYINDWKAIWRSGETNAPGIKELNDRMVAMGVPPPSNAKAATGAAATSYHLANYPGPVTKVAGGGITPNQYDPAYGQIKGWDRDAACGITAGVGVARSLGLRPEMPAALQAAQQSGWNATDGMGGTANQIKYMERMGIPVVAQYDAKGQYIPERADPRVVDSELAAGRPVIIDTNGIPGKRGAEYGHYFAIVGKTEQGYVVSGSGTALTGGKEVMTQREMESAMGGWRNMVRLDPNRVAQVQQQPPAPSQQQPAPSQSAVPFSPTATPPKVAPGQAPPGTGMKISVEQDEPDTFGDYVQWSAASHGIDPKQVAAVMGMEGPSGWTSVGNFVDNPPYSGMSYGPLQLHYAAGRYPQEGMGDRFTRDTGIDLRKVDPRTPEGVRAHKLAVDYAMRDLLKDGNYSQWYGADNPKRDRTLLPNGRATKITRIDPKMRR